MPKAPKLQSTKDTIVKDGTVVDALRNTGFKVQMDPDQDSEEAEGPIVQAVLSGKLRRHYIRIFTGDRVRLEFSPHDLSLGRIVYRHKK